MSAGPVSALVSPNKLGRNHSFSDDAMFVTNSINPAFHTEVCIVGAGVIGLAIARALSFAGKEVLVVDKSATIASETSSRNSEVIHAGIYYPSNSWKALFCVQGKQKIYDYCNERHIPYNNCGKLIVATQLGQVTNELETFRRQALANGVTDVKILTSQDVRVMEPQVECVGGALWSPSTGVLDSHSFMTSLLADAEDKGTTLALHTAVEDANVGEKLLLKFTDGTWMSCDYVVNAAGLWAHRIAKLFHPSSSQWQPPRQYFAKGTYFHLQGVRPLPFQHLIYPIPEPGGLGVHATLDWAGQSIKFGPDVEWVDDTTELPSQISLEPNPQRGENFYEEVRKYWPHLADGKLAPDYVGIRAKLNHPINGKVGFEDFRIIDEKTHGVRGLVHLFGIESPGLTSSMAIGDYVSKLVHDQGGTK